MTAVVLYHYHSLKETQSVEDRVATLLDLLSSEQFRTTILLTLGLDIQQIADLLETSDRTVCKSLRDCLVRAECQSVEDLAARLLFENEKELYDVRLKKEVAELQSAVMRMLENTVSASYEIC
jgi:DNA-binding NarL/FixJ family response regulator